VTQVRKDTVGQTAPYNGDADLTAMK
jgi:hypothetical protein